MTAGRILIAEGDRSGAEDLRDRLERMGWTVTDVVHSGSDAVVRAEATLPDLVFIDIHLNGEVDAIAAASTIRDRFAIPTVYLTTPTDDAAIERARKTHPAGYLIKPVGERELQATLKLTRQNSHELVEKIPISPMEPALSSEAIQVQLQKILSSRALVQSKRLAQFLSFIVDKGLKGEGKGLNEYLIGVEAYERSPSFDPQVDTIVRSEARRLRLKLRQYYETEGISDPILIEIPKGSYAPGFRIRERGILDRSPGQLVSHYRLLAKLGEGRMGTIYLAEDTRLGRQVALKFIHTSRLKEKQAKDRLFREARTAASIDHPNVAAIYEVSEVEHQPFIAMAYIKGKELEERVSEGPLEIAEALDIGSQLADGLAAAHTQGVVHCDLSPANVILSAEGRVRIIDFGVAKLSSATRLSEPSLMGTANYVSPEQMKGEPVDFRTDIWALGVILYEILTGKRPFEADHREAVYYAIAHKTPEPMSRWRAGIPATLESIVFKCLEKDPSHRYQDAAILKADLSAMHLQGLWIRDNLPRTAPFPSGDDKEAEPQPATAPSQTPPVISRRSLGPFAGWVVAAIVAALLVWFGTTQQPKADKVSATDLSLIPRLVVLPFESRTPGEENQALSYAISDSLITNLAKLRGLQVTSWTTVMRLTERKATLPEIAKILNVQYALEGSLLKSGQQGHVTVQLIRVSDDSHVWAEEFDFPWKNLVTIRERVSESVARQMKIELQPGEQRLLARNSTESMGAYQARARGRYGLVRYTYLRDPAYLIEAEKHFKRALEEDPKYADVLADLAYTSYLRFYPPQGERKELTSQGIAYAEQALVLEPSNVVALYVLGSLYDHAGQSDKGLELCQKAVELAPDDPEAHHHLAWRYLERGFYESGIEENREAIAKDSLFLDPYFFQTLFLTRLGKYQEARATVRKLEESEPTSTYPILLRANIAFSQGDLVQAEAGWRQVLETSPQAPERTNVTRLLLAMISARKGRIEEARQVLQKFETHPGRASDYPIKLAALVGEKDLAIDQLRESQLYRNYRWMVTEPDIASLRTEPRFRDLLVELYQKWQRDLSSLGPSLPVPPPKLPTPEEFLRNQE